MAVVLRVTHGDLPIGSVSFSDNEVVTMAVRPEGQTVIPQRSQTGSLSFVRIGREQFAFDLVFNIFQRATLDNLNRIRALEEMFILYPFVLDSPLSSFEVEWGNQPYAEQWVRGRRRAGWDYSVTWQETTTLSCAAVVGS